MAKRPRAKRTLDRVYFEPEALADAQARKRFSNLHMVAELNLDHGQKDPAKDWVRWKKDNWVPTRHAATIIRLFGIEPLPDQEPVWPTKEWLAEELARAQADLSAERAERLRVARAHSRLLKKQAELERKRGRR